MTGGLRYKFCPDCGELHDVHEWPDNHRRPEEGIYAPSVISDNQPLLRSMADGNLYDSKAAMRRSYLPSGNKEGKRYTEVGNDPSILTPKPYVKPKPPRHKIKEAVGRAFSRAGLGA